MSLGGCWSVLPQGYFSLGGQDFQTPVRGGAQMPQSTSQLRKELILLSVHRYVILVEEEETWYVYAFTARPEVGSL